MNKIILLNLAAVFLTAASGRAETRLVPSEYITIQAAIDAAVDGDTVIVAPGTYTGDGNRDIDFRGKAVTVRSEGGPSTCIIDCQGSRHEFHRGFYFHSGEDASSVLDGFTVTGGFVGSGGGILCAQGSPYIRNCSITGNSANWGGGVTTAGSDVVMSNCVITGNRTHEMDFSDVYGAGVSCLHGYPVFRNCVIYANRSTAWGGGIASDGGRGIVTLENCIVTGNTARYANGSQIRVGGCTTRVGCMGAYIVNCCIEDDPNAIFVEGWHIHGEPPGISYITADPNFAAPGYWDPSDDPDYSYDDFWVDGDYHLKSQAGRWDPNSQSWAQDDVTSPCIDAGDPSTPIGDEPFPNGGIVNIGAYGGTAEASKSYFGEPVCEAIVAGDINGDCKVDFADLRIMALHWLEDNRQEAELPQ